MFVIFFLTFCREVLISSADSSDRAIDEYPNRS